MNTTMAAGLANGLAQLALSAAVVWCLYVQRWRRGTIRSLKPAVLAAVLLGAMLVPSFWRVLTGTSLLDTRQHVVAMVAQLLVAAWLWHVTTQPPSLLTITRGLPGSGKSTWSRQQQDAWLIGRDALREMTIGLHRWPYQNREYEDNLTAIQSAAVKAALRRGLHVIVDDCNLDEDYVQRLHQLARRAGAAFHVQDFTDVDVETCIARDALREKPVGGEVIRRMHDRYQAQRGNTPQRIVSFQRNE